MLELDDTVAAAVAAPVAAPPAADAIRDGAGRRRRRRRSTGVVATVCVVTGLAAGALALVPPSTGPTHVRTADGASPATGPTPAPSAVTRPVLSTCTPTSAQEGTVTGAGVTEPDRPGEVFADPGRGARGPLAVFVVITGVDHLASTPNAIVAGGQARVDVASSAQGGVDWLMPDGKLGVIRAHGLSTAELTALATAVSGTRGALPAALTSLGASSSASWARSTCSTERGVRASVEVVRGSQAARYARLVTEPTGSSWDSGDTTFLVVSAPGVAAAGPGDVRQATDAQWQQLVAAAAHPATSPTTMVPGGG